MSVTTIKVDSEVRDRLAALAAERSMTQGSVIEMLIEEYVWSQRMEDVRRAKAATSAADLASYHAESAEWDALTTVDLRAE